MTGCERGPSTALFLVTTIFPIVMTGECLVMAQKMDAGRRMDQWLQALFGHSADLEHSLRAMGRNSCEPIEDDRLLVDA